MIEIKPRYRVRLENALIHSGHCAIEITVEASSVDELHDSVASFMRSIGVRSSEFEIYRIRLGGIGEDRFVRDAYLVGCHWRMEEVTREENSRSASE